MAELPQLLQLQQRYPDDLVGITLNIDHADPDSQPSAQLQQNVIAKLTELAIDSRNYIAADGMDEVLAHYHVFGLPAVLVFDAQGQLARKFEGSFTYQKDIVPLIEQLVNDRP